MPADRPRNYQRRTQTVVVSDARVEALESVGLRLYDVAVEPKRFGLEESVSVEREVAVVLARFDKAEGVCPLVGD